MRAMGTRELLNVWERSIDAPWLGRARNLLIAANSDLSFESFDALCIGEMDRRLIQLRQAIFGSEARCVSRCPKCGVDIDFSIRTDQLLISRTPSTASDYCYSSDDETIRFRSPRVSDLIALAEWSSSAGKSRSSQAAVHFLLERCIIECSRPRPRIFLESLTEDAVNTIASELEAMDWDSQHEISMTCPDCDHAVRAPFEILSFIWNELSVWARRILIQVHQLASAYGWSEADILAMSDRRRNLYLEMLGAAGGEVQ